MKRRIIVAAGGVLAAGILALGTIGVVTAQGPTGLEPGGHGLGQHQGRAGHGSMVGQHSQMQGALAQGLGLTTEQLKGELAAGKTVPQIAQERGVDLTKLRETMPAQHPTSGGPGPGFMDARGGHGPRGPGHGSATQ